MAEIINPFEPNSEAAEAFDRYVQRRRDVAPISQQVAHMRTDRKATTHHRAFESRPKGWTSDQQQQFEALLDQERTLLGYVESARNDLERVIGRPAPIVIL